MRLVPVTPQTWSEFCGFFTERKQNPPNPAWAILVCNDKPDSPLIAGVCAYPMADGKLFLEHLSWHPKAGPKLIAKAFAFMAKVAEGLGCVTGSAPVMISGNKTIVEFAQQNGFQVFNGVVLVMAPGQSPAVDEDEPEDEAPEPPRPAKTAPKGQRPGTRFAPRRRPADDDRDPLLD